MTTLADRPPGADVTTHRNTLPADLFARISAKKSDTSVPSWPGVRRPRVP